MTRPGLRYAVAMRMAPTALLAACLAAGTAGAASLDAGLAAQGWRAQPIEGAASSLAFAAERETGIRIDGMSGRGIVFLPVRVPVSPALCLTWRWRVEHGSGPGGLVLQVGFEPDAERMSLAERYALGFARSMSRGRMVPGFALSYRWGAEPGEPAWHPTPLLALLERTRAVRRADAQTGLWVEERVRLASEFRAAYGIAPTAYVTELAIGAVAGAMPFSARIEAIGFRRC